MRWWSRRDGRWQDSHYHLRRGRQIRLSKAQRQGTGEKKGAQRQLENEHQGVSKENGSRSAGLKIGNGTDQGGTAEQGYSGTRGVSARPALWEMGRAKICRLRCVLSRCGAVVCIVCLTGFESGSRRVFSKNLPHCVFKCVSRGGRRASEHKRSIGEERRHPVMVRQAE